jgi:glycosyltransferase involved in cell wall biosynthesis
MPSAVSVVMPAFNGCEFVREALDSAVRQTQSPREIIVVDDASADGTPDAVTEFAKTAPLPVRLIRLAKNSGGPAHPINVGIAASSGEFIAVLDQDDVLEPTKLEEQSRVLASDAGLSLVFCWCGHVGGGDERTWQSDEVKHAHLTAGQARGGYHRIRGEDMLRFLLRYSGYVVGYPAFLFRRRDWERKGGVDEHLRIASDFELTGWLAERGDCGLIPKIGYRRRVHATNVSHRVVEMHREVARVKNAWLLRHPFLLRDHEVRANVRGGYHGLAHRYREQGRYREALSFLLSSVRVWGPSGDALSALCKLPLHWLLKRASRQQATPSAANCARREESASPPHKHLDAKPGQKEVVSLAGRRAGGAKP